VNNAQTIFTLFYGLYFAASIPLSGPLRPFDTASMYKLEWRSWVRFIAAFTVLNAFPLAYFILVFNRLGAITSFRVSFWPMLSLLAMSLAGFGFYRIYYGLMLLKLRGNFIFYGAALPQRLIDDLQQRGPNHSGPWPHVVPGIAWVVIPLLLGWKLCMAT